MNNPFISIVDELKIPTYKIFEEYLKGVVSNTTWYGMMDERGIPEKTQWSTVERVAQALGYEIIFRKTNGGEK